MRNREISPLPIEDQEEIKPISDSLKKLPQNVQEIFQELPSELQEKIFPSSDRNDGETGDFIDLSGSRSMKDVLDLDQDRKKTPQEIRDAMSNEDREYFAVNSLYELFRESDFRERLKTVEPGQVKQEILRFMETLWENRGKPQEEVEIFNQDYYDQFAQTRNELTAKKQAKQEEFDEVKKGEKDKKRVKRQLRQKGYATNYSGKYLELESELKQLKDEIADLDEKNHNTEYDRTEFNGVESRQRKEREATQQFAVVSEYLDSLEFSTYTTEVTDILFSPASRIAKKKPGSHYLRRELTSSDIERAKATMTPITEAIDDWYAQHEEDKPLIDSGDAKIQVDKEKKLEKLIAHFRAHVGSYIEQIEKWEKNPEELAGFANEIAVVLHLIKKHHT